MTTTAPTITRPVEYRCPVCNRKLIVGAFTGWAEVHCPRCGKNRRIDAKAA